MDAGGLATSTARQVLAPLVAGVVFKACAGWLVEAVEPALSIVGIVALIIIVLGTTSLSAELIKTSWSFTLAPVADFHVVGFWLGFGVARLLFRMRRPVATAVAFESGFACSELRPSSTSFQQRGGTDCLCHVHFGAGALGDGRCRRISPPVRLDSLRGEGSGRGRIARGRVSIAASCFVSRACDSTFPLGNQA